MPSTDIKLELKAKTSMAQTASQAAVYAKGLSKWEQVYIEHLYCNTYTVYRCDPLYID
jgi:hypothetical protein